jgi:hypothetical protein
MYILHILYQFMGSIHTKHLLVKIDKNLRNFICLLPHMTVFIHNAPNLVDPPPVVSLRTEERRVLVTTLIPILLHSLFPIDIILLHYEFHFSFLIF